MVGFLKYTHQLTPPWPWANPAAPGEVGVAQQPGLGRAGFPGEHPAARAPQHRSRRIQPLAQPPAELDTPKPHDGVWRWSIASLRPLRDASVTPAKSRGSLQPAQPRISHLIFPNPAPLFQQLPPPHGSVLTPPLHFPLPNPFRGLAPRGEADRSKSGVCESSQAPTSGGPGVAGHGAMRELGNGEVSPQATARSGGGRALCLCRGRRMLQAPVLGDTGQLD